MHTLIECIRQCINWWEDIIPRRHISLDFLLAVWFVTRLEVQPIFIKHLAYMRYFTFGLWQPFEMAKEKKKTHYPNKILACWKMSNGLAFVWFHAVQMTHIKQTYILLFVRNPILCRQELNINFYMRLIWKYVMIGVMHFFGLNINRTIDSLVKIIFFPFLHLANLI